MTESRNIFDILSKIEWEGGIGAVLEYGLRSIDEYDVPDALKEAWEEMAECFAEYELLEETVAAMLHKAETKYNEEKEF